MSSALLSCLATTGPMAEIFSDSSVLQAMLDFESALARAEALAGLIPVTAAEAIGAAARPENFDAAEIACHAMAVATPAIHLVKLLADRVRTADTASAGFVHWGATSQDVTDTAMVLLLRRARAVLAGDQQRLRASLRRLSDEHAATPMLSRTLLQPSPPVTFGLKAAGWLAAITLGWRRVESAFEDALVLQFGGASGTLAALGNRGPEVSAALARELGLKDPAAPWHAHRGRLAALLASSAIYVGSLGKMARDIALLMQFEVGEVAEPGGGSSTMPHKRNPSGCAIVLAAANRMPGLVASFLSGMVQEQERAAGGYQAEWPVVAGAIQTTGAAASAAARVVENLHVFPERMRANIAATRGTVFAERAMMALATKMGRENAHRRIEEGLASGQPLNEVAGVDLPDLESPEAYLGSAEHYRKRLIED